jgi:3-dehydroquinate synthase
LICRPIRMKTITVNLKERSYRIILGTGIIRFLGKYLTPLRLGDFACVVTNPLLKRRYGAVLMAALKHSGFNARFILVPDTEKSKSFEAASRLIKILAGIDRKKRVFIIAFGGGVIGDLAGFTASIYRRGIPCIQIPTTLLAQVDSAIGGKTAVDLAEGKNLAGAFYQPRLVFSDTAFLRSLPAKQIASGMAEVIKYAAVKDPQLFAYLEKNISRILTGRCSAIKAEIVHQDEREEKGIRTILNFGHTLGHAIETAGKYRGYTHGEAVALGMLIACNIGTAQGLTTRETTKRIESLIQKTGLPTKINKTIPIRDIIKSHYYDKKFQGAKNKFVLLHKIGDPLIVENIPLKTIQSALLNSGDTSLNY